MPTSCRSDTWAMGLNVRKQWPLPWALSRSAGRSFNHEAMDVLNAWVSSRGRTRGTEG